MSSFALNIELLIKQALPNLLGKVKMIAFLKVLTHPVGYVHTLFQDYRTSSNYNLTINSQVCRLRKALRDKFNNNLIDVVTNEDAINESYMYTVAEEQEQSFVIYTVAEDISEAPIFLQEELNNQIDFVVEVPEAVEASEEAIIAFVNRYRFAEKKFIIQIV